DPSTVTALVKKLAAAGYVRTEKRADDRRATVVSLTARGQELRGDFAAISRELLAVQSRGIDAEEQETMCRVLAAMRENFERALGDV
ncbi:MarR family winged helix-turn-helix transcriptional regulator, partial [Eggerthella sinensis]